MHFFKYRNGNLYAEDVPVADIVKAYGTPLYIYSYNTLLRHFKVYDDAFDGVPHMICFAVKANSNTALLNLFAKNGGGADVVSGGEIFKALKAGVPANKIVYAGVGKTEDEIRYALKSRILMLNVESEGELRAIDRIARSMKVRAPVSLRVNPDIDPKTHPYISTGLRKNKFGIPIGDALECCRLSRTLRNIEIVGIQEHIGSQITRISPFVEALKKTLFLLDELKRNAINIRYLDIGGGLGISYKDEEPPVPGDLAKGILPMLKGRALTLIIEPGRSIAGNAGILVTKALYLKNGAEKDFIIVDAGMTDLVRPSLYGAYHRIQPLKTTRRKKIVADIVGPICESGDFLARDREMSAVNPGEYLAVMSAGAYGFSMSSNYNGRPKAAEVMVKGKKFALIRKRETYGDLTKTEIIPRLI